VVGPRYARFSSFLFGPAALLADLRGSPAAPRTLGHTPLGSLSVYALLIVVAVQATAGLFTSDDIASEGPLARLVSNATVETAGWLHHFNEALILALVALHLVAILFYRIFMRKSLVKPMVVGDRLLPVVRGEPEPTALASRDDLTIRLRALAVAAIAVAIVACIVNWPVFS
jgi:cytochrome b